MEIVERLRDRFSKELSRLPSQFRLMLLSVGVGIVAGVGAILFDRLLGWTLHAVLESFTGYAEPKTGSPAASLFTFAPVRSLWFFIIPTPAVSSRGQSSTWSPRKRKDMGRTP